MRLNRRAFLGGGVAASSWAWRGGAGAQDAAPADGFRRLEAAPAFAPIAAPPAAADAASLLMTAPPPGHCCACARATS